MIIHGETDLLLGLTAGSLNADLVPSFDVSDYTMATLQIAGAFVGTITFQGSNDNVNFVSLMTTNISNTNAPASTTTAAGVFAIPLGFKYLRVRMTAYTSGTATGTLAVSTLPSEAANIFVNGTVAISSLPTPTTSTLNSAATTNATSVKASAGTVYSITASNVNASARYLKFYNKASAPTVGTDIPVLVITLAPNSTVNVSFGELGTRFSTGIALAITGLAVDTDTTVIVASDVKVMTSYI